MGNFNRFGGGGFGGGANMQQLMKQAQKMQEDATRAKEELEETEVEGQAQNGAVAITLNGAYEPVSVKIKPEIVDPEDVEMLEDFVLVALQDATNKIEKLKNDKLGKFGGLI